MSVTIRTGANTSVTLSKRLYELVKSWKESNLTNEAYLCPSLKHSRVENKVYAFVPVKSRSATAEQCNRRQGGNEKCAWCAQFRNGLFGYWDHLSYKKEEEREIASENEITQYLAGEFMSEKELEERTSPIGSFGEAMKKAGIL